jgi:hypothetical protein
MLTVLPAASIEEEPSPYAIPEFHYDLDFVLNLVFAFALPPLESEEEFESVFGVLAPQYEAWINSQARLLALPPQTSAGANIVAGSPILPVPPVVIGPGSGSGDLSSVPEPSTLWTMTVIACAAILMRLPVLRAAVARKRG